jgi:hypothetical protein
VLNPVQKYLLDKVDFVPNPHSSQEEILGADKRFVLVAGGEQAGKSLVASKFLLVRYPDLEEAGLYWLVAADYERTRAEFDYLVEDFTKLGLLKRASKRTDPGYIELQDGTRIETKSSKDPRTLAMRAPNGIIMCEASQCDLETYWKCQGRVAPKRGWLMMAGTFETSLGWYPQMWTSWQSGMDDRKSYSLPSYTNPHLYPGGKDDPEIKRLEHESSDEFFIERIEGRPVPPRGLVFPEFRPDVFVNDNIEYEPNVPVHLWIDPGYGHPAAVEAVQFINGQVVVFDEIYERGLITEEIISVAMSKPWWKDVKFGVVDIYATQHQSQPAVIETWLDRTGIQLISNKVPINEGTERLKSFLKVDPVSKLPKIVFSTRCMGAISEFGAAASPLDGLTHVYRWKTDKEGNVVGDVPEDKNNDAVKALIYGLVDNYGYSRVTERESILVNYH